ncbi:MAG TPA: DUF2490 domain-containing protein [Terriglobia bacterium]|nr:DUF2490 domain-containing protein [Terriglobia bacterium]
MESKINTSFVVALVALAGLNGVNASGQNPDTGWELRPKVVAAIELRPRTRLDSWVETEHGLNFPFQRWRTGALLSLRMKPILKLHTYDIDQNRDNYVVLAGGYEFLHTVEEGETRTENRIIAEITPNIPLAGLLFSDRNRGEFRWIDGDYRFRYRNRLVIGDRLETGGFKYTPYLSGEVFYDQSRHEWNQTRYGFGVQFPYRKILMLDTYLLHQNCTGCAQSPVNMVGIILNLYLRRQNN